MNAREIAALVPMPRLLESLGFTVNERTRRCACLIHGGANPSAFSWAQEGWWKCYSCGAGGDRIALVRAVRECSFREAVEFLAKLAGISVPDWRVSPAECRRVQAECEGDLVAARFLLDAQDTALREARQELWSHNNLQRKLSMRLGELERGKPERWPAETDWALAALRYLFGTIARIDATYCIAAFSAPVERAASALHPEMREALIQAVLERGYVANAKGYQFEVNL
jgi:hypothetical protein